MHADDRRETTLAPTGFAERQPDLLRLDLLRAQSMIVPREGERVMDEQSLALRDDAARGDHRFRQGAENAATVMGFLDRDGHWLQVTQRLRSLLGYSPADVAVHTIFDLLGPDDQSAVATAFGDLLSGRRSSYAMTTRYRRRDGQQIWLDLTLTPLDPTDAAPRFFAVIYDVTRHHDAERRREILAEVSDLLASPHDLPRILDEVADATARAFDGWVTVDLADFADTLHRVAVSHPDPVQAAYLCLLNPNHGDDSPRRDPTTRRVMVVPLLARETRVGMLRVEALDWNRRYDTHDVGLAEEIGRRCAVVIDYARLLASERQAKAKTQAALALRDQFLSVAAHEFKTPLTSMLGMSQITERALARSETPDRERLRGYLGIVVDQGRKLAKLIDQALDVTRWEEEGLVLDRHRTDVTALVDGVVELARLKDPSHPIALEAGRSISALVDPLRLEQALTNLLDNAAKYSPPGSLIGVEVTTTPTALSLVVTDHGIGIPPDRRERIFERYYQAHHVSYRSGLGLGLFLSRQIVERHGGTLTVNFPEGGGTRFLIHLPLA